MAKILILEDDKQQLENVCSMFDEYNKFEIYAFDDILKAEQVWLKEKFDVYILDINVGGYNSISIVKNLLAKQPELYSKIIFTTAYTKYALNAIQQTHCYNYLLKPLKKQDLINSVESCLGFQTIQVDTSDYLQITVNRVKYNIIKDEIVYIESLNQKCIINTKTKSYTSSRTTLVSLLPHLNEKKNSFIQCHKSFIVNTKYFSSFIENGKKTSQIIMSGDIKIPVGLKFYESTSNIIAQIGGN